jgi:hypothetical protein
MTTYIGEYTVDTPPNFKQLKKLKFLIEEAKSILEEELGYMEMPICIIPTKRGTIHIFILEDG